MNTIFIKQMEYKKMLREKYLKKKYGDNRPYFKITILKEPITIVLR